MYPTPERPTNRSAHPPRARAHVTNRPVPPAAAGAAPAVLKFTGVHAVIALAVVVLAAFLPVRDNGFVSFDDKKNFLETASFRGLGRPQLVWAWTTGHFMPMMGLTALAASALCAVVGRGRAPRAVALSVFVATAGVGLALVAMTRDQCRTWHDSETLWSHAMAVSTEPNPFACHGLALVLAGEPGRLAQATSLLDEALRTVPDDSSLHNAMSTVLAKRGRTVEAMAHAREALRLAPDNVPAWVNLGNLLALMGDPAGAKAAYEAALRIDPMDADAHGNLGLILTVEGRTAEAEAHLAEALRHNPGLYHTRSTLDDLRRRRDRTGVSHDPARGNGR
jgi:Tetratricopeptide repeat